MLAQNILPPGLVPEAGNRMHQRSDFTDIGGRSVSNHVGLRSLTSLFRIVVGTQEMKRDVGLVAHNPAVVRKVRNGEQLAFAKFEYAPVLQRRHGFLGR